MSVGDYLRHTYYPDRDFVEGALLERNVGEIDHGDAQGRVAYLIAANCPRFWAAISVRVQIRPDRFRVPDVVIMRGGKPAGRIITTHEVKDGILHNPAGDLAVPLSAIFGD